MRPSVSVTKMWLPEMSEVPFNIMRRGMPVSPSSFAMVVVRRETTMALDSMLSLWDFMT